MVRYVIIASNPGDTADIQTVQAIRARIRAWSGWRLALDSPDTTIAVGTQESMANSVLHFDDNRGAIIGLLYRAPASYGDAPDRVHAIDRKESGKIIDSSGRALISDYWGHYVAVIRYPESGRVIVIRSPVSPLPCLHSKIGSLNIFFSHVADFVTLGIRRTSINWETVRAQVVGRDHSTAETGIREIVALECGESVECVAGACSTQSYWDPRSFLAERCDTDFDAAARALRERVEHSVHALADPHTSILVKLSGGLDSSIVLAALASAPHEPTLTAVNYHSRRIGDERHFARTMAAAVNCPLRELQRNQELDLRRFLDCNWTVKPVLNFSAPDTESRNIALARELSASAIFDGELGDNLFGSNPGPGALIEGARTMGAGTRFMSIGMDYARLTRQSIWRSLSLAYDENRTLNAQAGFSTGREMHRRHTPAAVNSMMLASSEAQAAHHEPADRFVHPWLKNSARLAPGSYPLLFGLITVTSPVYHSPFSMPGDPPRVSPLVTQPLVELALRIPAYLHFKSGMDRSVARRAFSNGLPEPILRRGTGKGGPTLWAKDIVENNIAFLREFLLDGILVRNKLIDRHKLEAALSPRIEKSSVIVAEIFGKLYIEAWLRKWQSLETRAMIV
jgi:asparagine synthase (glutamine-hydrolysing)